MLNAAENEVRCKRIAAPGVKTAAIDRLSNALGETLDQDQRVEQIVRMAQIFNDDLPAFPITYRISTAAHVAALDGLLPVRTTDATTGSYTWNVHEWQLR